MSLYLPGSECSRLSEKPHREMMYLNMCLSVVAGLLVEALVGGALQDKIPHRGWEKCVYSLNSVPIVFVHCAVVKPDQPSSFLWCHEKS